MIGVFHIMGASGRPASRWACAALLALSPLGLVVAGIFDFNAAPLLHLGGFLLVTSAPILGFLAAGFFFRGIPRWRRLGNWLFIASSLSLLIVVLFFVTFDRDLTATGQGVTGLVSRILGIEIHVWYVAMGWLAFRRFGEVTGRRQEAIVNSR